MNQAVSSSVTVPSSPSGDIGRNRHFDVLGVKVSAIDMSAAVETVTRWIDERTPRYVCITGVHGVMESQRNPALLSIHNAAGLVTPDGMPLVWMAHLQGRKTVERVYGPDLMVALSELSARKGYRNLYYGGGEGIAETLSASMTSRFPGLPVVGTITPPFRPLTPAEDDAMVERINALDPDIIWVGLSTPKQELWMSEHVGRLKAPVLIGVGAAFDFLSGQKRQAPAWMRRNGLEWLFRLLTEPRRLWRRYLRNNPEFLVRAGCQLAARSRGRGQ